ncbi:MAG: ATP-binding protein [Candidatus Bathyarchaeota archaeon]|jgi:MinD superfamily P-loop ATPase
MILSVASGKGGTGKTTVAVNTALSLTNVQLLDCDVEEPNVHLLLNPTVIETKPVYVLTPQINEEICDSCGECARFCEYNALFAGSDEVLVFQELCHGCGGCIIICPKHAITEKKQQIGTVEIGAAANIEVIFGELEVGKPMSVPVIKEVKKHIDKEKTVIIDSPPGISCPVVETIKGSDFCVLVTEPTPFGLHDLKIAVQVLKEMRVPFGVVVNRAGLGDKKVYEYCEENNIPILLEIPYQRKIAEHYSRGVPFSLEMPEWKEKFQTLFDKAGKLADK